MFQSTRPTRSATFLQGDGHGIKIVSIHTPHAERDVEPRPRRILGHRVSIHTPHAERDAASASFHRRSTACFNPHAPRGARPGVPYAGATADVFQSTRPTRSATSPAWLSAAALRCFNPHAPRGARRDAKAYVSIQATFQSTRPTRSATHAWLSLRNRAGVSIHTPHAERDGFGLDPEDADKVFQSTRPDRKSVV